MGSIPVRVMNKIPDLRIRDFFMQPVRGIEGTRPPAGGKKEPSGLFFSAPGCGSQHPRVPWAALASCWPLPQQLLPASATGRGRRCCRSHPVGMSTVVAAAALRKGVFNLTRTGIVAELTAASEQRLPPVGGRCRIATKRGVQGCRGFIKQYLQKLPQWGRFGVTSVTPFLLLPVHPEGYTPAHHT